MNLRSQNGGSAPPRQPNPLRKNILLIPEPPLQVLPSLAKAIGLNEAIVLQQVFWLLGDFRNGRDFEGKKWIFNTYEQWQARFFTFWSIRTIERVFAQLETMLILESCQPEGRASRRKWYRVNEGMLMKLTEEKLHQNPDPAKLADSMPPKRRLPITENTSEKTLSKETKATPKGFGASGFASHESEALPDQPAQWIPHPIRRMSKEEQLRKIRAPKDFPSEQEYEDFLFEQDLGDVMNYRQNLYRDLCINKWHQWDAESSRWRPVRDWRAFVRALNEKMTCTF